MSILVKIKKGINNYIARLEKSNKEEFGTKGLDCCELNKKGK